MAPEDEEVSRSDSDDGFEADLEALKNACILTGKNPGDLHPSPPPSETFTATAESRGGAATVPESDSETDSVQNDLELVRNIQRQFAISTDVGVEQPLTLQPLSSLPPDDDYEDDFEAIRAIHRRFAAYNKDIHRNATEGFSHKADQVGATNVASEKESSNNLFVERTNVGEGFPNSVDANNAITRNSEVSSSTVPVTQSSDLIVWHSDAENVCASLVRHSAFPKSAQVFIDAIKKNRSYQKFLRSKLVEIEARIEENKKLKERVKILKDFQVTCRKRTGRALSQKKDARVQLISVPKQRANAKANDKKVPAMYYGPPENSHVANYRKVLTQYPVLLRGEKWSKEEKENLAKGIKQQFQEMLLQKSVDQLSGADGSLGDPNDLDSIVASIRDHDITPENIRLFLPKVDWEQLAYMYVPSHSGAECEARWLNSEDPLINRHPWTKVEDKDLLHIVQQKGIENWIDTAVSLGTNRTPFQCLARYQRSLNASILKREWTEDEDDKLRAAVEAFGESNWQVVASTMEGRTGTQCSNRWIKSLHPARQRVGQWTLDEDKRLKVAVMLFGPKTWRKIAQFVPGRTHVQCRERWVNCLDPSLNMGKWTKEEDSRLKAAITKYGYCWSKVAACVAPRTDSQCRRRWKVLLPHEVPLLQAARKIQKAALISNFVDRESERPALGPGDFIPIPEINAICEYGNASASGKQKRRSRRRSGQKKEDTTSSCPEDVPMLTCGNEIETCSVENAIPLKKGMMKRCSKNKKSTAPIQGPLASCSDPMLAITSGDLEKFDGYNTTKKRATRRKRKSASGRDSREEHRSSCKDASSLAIVHGEEVDGNIFTQDRCVEPCEGVLINANANESEILVGDDTISRKNGRKPKLYPRKKRDTTPVQDQSSCLPLSVLRAGTGEDVAALGESEIGKSKTVPKPYSINKCTELSVIGQNPSSTPTNWEMTMPCTDGIEPFTGNYVLLNENVVVEEGSELPPRYSTPGILESGNSRAFTICQQNRCKKSNAKGSNEPQTKDGDNTTLASFRLQAATTAKSTMSSSKLGKLYPKHAGKTKIVEGSQSMSLSVNCLTSVSPDGRNPSTSGASRRFGPERSRSRSRNYSNHMSEGEDGDDMTLASFCNSLKKRRLEIPNEKQTNS